MTLEQARLRVQLLVRKLIPQPIRDRAKLVIGGLGSVVQIVNLTVPNYSDEATAIVGAIVAIATLLGINEIPNEPVEVAVEKQRKRRALRP